MGYLLKYRTIGMQFVWRASNSLPSKETEAFTHVMDTYSYCTDGGIPFDPRGGFYWNGIHFIYLKILWLGCHQSNCYYIIRLCTHPLSQKWHTPWNKVLYNLLINNFWLFIQMIWFFALLSLSLTHSAPVNASNVDLYAQFMVANIVERAAWFRTPHLLWSHSIKYCSHTSHD